jgi:hypothetical protein
MAAPVTWQAILEALKAEGGTCRLGVLVARFGTSGWKVRAQLLSLQRQGLVCNPRYGVWSLATPGPPQTGLDDGVPLPRLRTIEQCSVAQLPGDAGMEASSTALPTPDAIAGLRPSSGPTTLQTALANVQRQARGLERFYVGRVPQPIAVALTLARTHLEDALERSRIWEAS